LALFVACSDTTKAPAASDAGDEASSPADAALDGGTCTLSGSFGSPKCNECVQASCCDVIGACSADQACSARMACMFACADSPDAGGCARVCAAEHPDQGKWDEVESCATLKRPCVVHCSSLGP
jgi:hypothetical protein